METTNEIIVRDNDKSVFSGLQLFEEGQRIAKGLASSTLVPKDYQGNIANTLVALEMANRIGANVLSVMQNLYIVHGKPSWSSQFIIAAINSCGKFSPLRFIDDGESCYAYAIDKSDGERLTGPKITMQMANQEGWISKNGSKWKTMPELMRRYRAASFFGKLYAPEVLMGMQTEDEQYDIGIERDITPVSNIEDINEKLSLTEKTEPKSH